MAMILADGNYGVQSRHDSNDYVYLTYQHTGGGWEKNIWRRAAQKAANSVTALTPAPNKVRTDNQSGISTTLVRLQPVTTTESVIRIAYPQN